MKKPWLYYITPLIFVSVFAFILAIIGLADIDEGEGWSIIGLFLFFPVAFILLTIDWLVKKITKDKLLYIWIIEIILLGIGLMCIPELRLSGC